MADEVTEPVSLLEVLKRGGGFEAALVTTFNAYLPFVEEVVLRRLWGSGCHYVVAMMDAEQLAADLAEETRRPTMAGRRYALLPVPCDGAFHPKIIALVGPKSARVVVGSHNLTMSGFGLNRELTNVIEVRGPKDRAGSAALIEAVEFAQAWSATLPKPFQTALLDFATFCRPYQGPVPTDDDVRVVGSRPDGASLWQRVRPILPERATRITVLGPFFDGDFAFVRRLAEELAPDELVVGVDPATVNIIGDAKSLPKPIRFVDASALDPGHGGRGYIHAKAVLIESAGKSVLVSGSANPTAAAWLAAPGSRNAEAVVVRRLSGTSQLGLERLAQAPAVSSSALPVTPRPSKAGDPQLPAPLFAFCEGADIVIDEVSAHVDGVMLRDSAGARLSSTFAVEGNRVVVSTSDVDAAATFELTAGGDRRCGFVHHAQALRDSAVSSSQRRLREALTGLQGDPTQLEGLLKLVEKVIFDAPTAPRDPAKSSGGSESTDGDDATSESSVVLVPSLRGEQKAPLRRLSGGDLGLLLDALMRKLWQSLTHSSSTSTRVEGDLIGSDDEDLVAELPADPAIADAWCRKSRTLLRRLSRRVEEGVGAAQIVAECAAVLGVLEALRRVEDHERWRKLGVEFVDRAAAATFFIESVPKLLKQRTGLFEAATDEYGGPFAEQHALLEWLTWLAWLTGFGPDDLVKPDEERDDDQLPDAWASAAVLASRVLTIDPARVIDLLAAAPFPGVSPQVWFTSLLELGEVFIKPTVASGNRPPVAGDLVMVPGQQHPCVVREVRGTNVEVIDFDRAEGKIVFKMDRVKLVNMRPRGAARATA